MSLLVSVHPSFHLSIRPSTRLSFHSPLPSEPSTVSDVFHPSISILLLPPLPSSPPSSSFSSLFLSASPSFPSLLSPLLPPYHQLLRECRHENIVTLQDVHMNMEDMSLYLAFDYAEHDLYVRTRGANRTESYQIYFISTTSMYVLLLLPVTISRCLSLQGACFLPQFSPLPSTACS